MIRNNKVIRDLDFLLYISKPFYISLDIWDFFHVDDDIFWELETIIGEKQF